MTFLDKELQKLDDIVDKDNRLKYEAYGPNQPKKSDEELAVIARQIAAIKSSNRKLILKELSDIK